MEPDAFQILTYELRFWDRGNLLTTSQNLSFSAMKIQSRNNIYTVQGNHNMSFCYFLIPSFNVEIELTRVRNPEFYIQFEMPTFARAARARTLFPFYEKRGKQ